jgi:hypothetical protein
MALAKLELKAMFVMKLLALSVPVVAASAILGTTWMVYQGRATPKRQPAAAPAHTTPIVAANKPKEPPPNKSERDVRADRAKSQDNLRRIGAAMHKFHDRYHHLPTAAIYSKDGRPAFTELAGRHSSLSR